MFKKLSVCIFAALACVADAQTSLPFVMPSEAEVAAKRLDALKAVGTLQLNNGALDAQMKSNSAGANAAVEVNKSNATQADFMNLSRPAYAQPTQPAQKPIPADLMIFVSLSMPEKMLEQYTVQAKRFGAVLIMRGFVNDKMSDTKEALIKLNSSGAQWEISPEPFKQFKIDKVPAIVMASADSGSIAEDGCARPETFTTIFGDMSVLDALDKMHLRGQKEIAVMAQARIMADRRAAKR